MSTIEHVNPGQTRRHIGPATVCLGKADYVEVAREVWRRQDGSDVWWAPYRDGRPEVTRQLAARK